MAHTYIDILRAFGRLEVDDIGMLPYIHRHDRLNTHNVPDLVIADLFSLCERGNSRRVTRIGADIELYYTDTARLLARGSRKQAPVKSRAQYALECLVRVGWKGLPAEEN
jgi:hypothetical protein